MTHTIINKFANHPLQTYEWGKFRESWGNEVLYTKHGILTLHKLPLINKGVGMFIRVNTPTQAMLNDLKTLAIKHNLIFIKLEPNTDSSTIARNDMVKLLKKNGCVKGKTLFTPTSFQIDLTKAEVDLMKSFSSKTRYNIRLAQRKGVEISEDNNDNAFNKYLDLTKETVERQGFYAHNERYHRLMWQTLHKAGIAKLLVAKYKGEIITTWILFIWKDFLYYPYGASSTKYKNVMANNLMMWEAIKLGKKMGLKKFDLWGREPGKGFTKFKEGYNPKVIEFIGTWDLITSKLYWPYRIADFFRWRILRFKSKFTKPKF